MKDSTIWIGIDDHADSVKVSVFASSGSEPVERFELVPDERGLRQLVRRLKAYGVDVRCVYEAGPCGYELYRYLRGRGISCEVAAPALTPRRPGERVKTDRRDADKLGRLYRAGELILIRVPDEGQEALRDLVRAREDGKEDLLCRRHRLSKFLLRHGHRYRQGQNWTQRHWAFIRSIHFDDIHAQAVLEEYVLAIAEQVEQVKRLERLMEEASHQPQYAEQIGHLKVLRGVATTTALTILSEVGDLSRYTGARQLMGATGLVPREHSSGSKRRQAAITKTGNAHLRSVLVEAAWHYRHRPWPGPPSEPDAPASRRPWCHRSPSRRPSVSEVPPSYRSRLRPVAGLRRGRPRTGRIRHWTGILENESWKGGIGSNGGERYGGSGFPASKGEPSRQLCGGGNPNRAPSLRQLPTNHLHAVTNPRISA